MALRRRRLLRRRRRDGLGPIDRVTLGIGAVAVAATAAAVALEFGRVWRRGSAPLPSETDDLLGASAEAAAETVEVARSGYRTAPTWQNSTFNMMFSFALTFGLARAITTLLRARSRVGPFRSLRVGDRHIHHFVPGIAIAFASGAAAILTRDEEIEPKLALGFGVGMGLTLDESALLLELEDVYWRREGMLSVQIGLGVLALLSSFVLGVRILRRGEKAVLQGEQLELGH